MAGVWRGFFFIFISEQMETGRVLARNYLFPVCKEKEMHLTLVDKSDRLPFPTCVKLER